MGPATVFVGFSGGMDSTVLLHLLSQWREQCHLAPRSSTNVEINLKAIHVNHKLQPEADLWQQHCQRLCERWQIPLIIEQVSVDLKQSSPEQAARNARYSAFARHVGNDDILMLAHHRDDQVETVLQRLARGSGALGLGAMQADSYRSGMRILRPLLEQDRVDLAEYADIHKLHWVDDPSNQSDRYERNFIRQQILPPWRRLKPSLNQTIARSARLNREAAQLLDQLAALDLAQPCADGGLAVARLNGLDRPRQKNLLRYWLKQNGVRAPGETTLSRVFTEIISASEDGNPMVSWGHVCIRRYQQVLYLTPSELKTQPSGEWDALNGVQAIQGLYTSLGYFGVQFPDAGQGDSCKTGFSLKRLQSGCLRLALRAGGERVKPAGQHTNSLKHWFQVNSVPPWLRPHWPVLYCDEQIAGLPGLLVCEGFAAESAQDLVNITWHWQLPLRGESESD